MLLNMHQSHGGYSQQARGELHGAFAVEQE